jgi:hypothetical protein
MEKPTKFTFSNGRIAQAVRVQHMEELPAGLHELGLHSGQPVLVLIGGAGRMDTEALNHVRAFFAQMLVPVVVALGGIVIDGGTDTGVMQLMGQARAITHGAFPLIGVAPTGTVTTPDMPNPPHEAAQLEPHHTHFVLVPGTSWGDESPWLFHVADVLSTGATAVTVLVNGGKTAWEDVTQSVKAGRPVVVVGGSGRTADELASALRGETADERAKSLVPSKLLRVVDITSSYDELASTLRLK